MGALRITPEILWRIAEIDEFKGAWRAVGAIAPERLAALRRLATIESIASTMRLDGGMLSDRSVETLLADPRLDTQAIDDARGVAGCADAVELVVRSSAILAINEDNISKLHHSLLVGRAGGAALQSGYKTAANSVVALDEEGHPVAVGIETAAPADTPRLMAELVRWFADTVEHRRLHPLLVIAIFTMEFLAIHPFQEGNGRLSRILAMLMLLRAGYAFVAYGSFDRVIEENKGAYCTALRHMQQTIRTDRPDWEPWLLFFLDALQQQKARLERAIGDGRLPVARANLSQHALRILDCARDHGRVSIGDVVRLTGASRNTLKEHFRRLVEDGYLSKHGGGRSTWYVPGLAAADR